jgi:hypothetical protein
MERSMKRDPNRKYKIAAIIVSILMIVGMILPYLAGAFR